MPWYLFALLTPTLYSFNNFIDKYIIEKKIKEPLVMTAIASIISGILGIIIGLVTGFVNIGLFQISLIMFAGFLLIFYLLPYYEAIKIEDASTVVPLFQFIPIFTLILSAVILNETLTFKQTVGLMIVVIAGISIASEKLEGKLFKPRKSLWFMIVSSLMYSAIGILFRFVAKEASFWTTLSYEYIGCGIGGFLLFLLPKVRKNILSDIQQIKSTTGLIGLNNSISIIANISVSYAFTLATAPMVNLLGSIQSLLSLGEGYFLTKKFPNLIKENIRNDVIKNKLAFIILIFFGLYLVYL
jgi:drug/metabolite transporter (DMT)-like permease